MNRKSSSLLLTALAAVGLSGVAHAQETFTIGAANFLDNAGTATNEIYTATATSSYVVGGTVNMISGDLTIVATASVASEARVRMRNSGFPNLVLDFQVSTTAGTIGAASRVATGSLIGSSVLSGSTWSMELFDAWDDAPGLADASTTGFVFGTNTGTALTAPATVHLETVSGTNPFKDAAGTAGNFTIAGGTAASPFVLYSDVVIKGGYWTNAWNYNNTGQNGVRLGHTAYPTLFMTFVPIAQTASEAVGSVVGFGTNRTVVASGTLIGSAIPASGNFTIEYYDTTNSGYTTTSNPLAVLGDIEATATDLSFGLTADTTNVLSSPVLAGPFLAVGNPYAGNGTFTIGVAPTTFTMRNQIKFSGTGIRVATDSVLSQTRLRVRNSAYPGMSAEFVPTTSTSTLSVAISNAVLTSPGTSLSNNAANALKWLTIPAGSTFTGELFDSYDQSGTDSSWTNVQVTIMSGNAPAVATPPVAFDLGTISDATLTATLTSATAPFTTGTVSWYKFTVPAGLNGQSGRFLDIWTTCVNTTTHSTDTVLCLYNSNGYLIANDDDSAALPQFLSQITYGLPLQTTAPWALTTTDMPFNGRDGDGLAPGVYYLGVSNYSATKGDGFVMTTAAPTTTNQGTTINIRTNVPANQNLTGTLNLGDTVGSLFYNRSIAYSVMQGTSTVGSGTVVASNSATGFSITLPASATGAATIVWDGSSFLKRNTNVNLTGSNASIGSVTMQNGDVDNSGEVDAVDIDQVIANFGLTTDIPADVDVSGEVDAVDIDIVIANFSGLDD